MAVETEIKADPSLLPQGGLLKEAQTVPRGFLHQAKRTIKTALARMGVLDGFRKPFNYVEFETTAYCNRACTYCPVSMYERPGDENITYMS